MGVETLREVVFSLNDCDAYVERALFDDLACEETLLLEQARVHLRNAAQVVELVMLRVQEQDTSFEGIPRCPSDTLPPSETSGGRESNPPVADGNGAAGAGGKLPYVPPTLRRLTVDEVSQMERAAARKREP